MLLIFFFLPDSQFSTSHVLKIRESWRRGQKPPGSICKGAARWLPADRCTIPISCSPPAAQPWGGTHRSACAAGDPCLGKVLGQRGNWAGVGGFQTVNIRPSPAQWAPPKAGGLAFLHQSSCGSPAPWLLLACSLLLAQRAVAVDRLKPNRAAQVGRKCPLL